MFWYSERNPMKLTFLLRRKLLTSLAMAIFGLGFAILPAYASTGDLTQTSLAIIQSTCPYQTPFVTLQPGQNISGTIHTLSW